MIGPPRVITELDQIEPLLDDWRALAERAARSPFESPDWLLPLARHYLAGDRARFLAWYDGQRLVGVAPLSLLRHAPPLRPLGQLVWWGTTGPRMRGLVDIVAEPAARGQVLESFSGWLADGGWDVLHILRPAPGSVTPARLRAAAARHGWRYAGYATARSTTYQLDLPPTVDEWHAFFGSKARRVLRSRLRRYAEFRGGRLDAAVPPTGVRATLEALERLLSERWGASEVYFRGDEAFRSLVHEAVPRMVERGSAWVSVASDESGIQGVLVSFSLNTTALAFLLAVTTDEAYRPFGLGKQLDDMAIEHAITRGCRVYDLLPVGDYKEQTWHATPRELESAVVGRGLVGRLAAGLLARRRGTPL